MSRDPLRPLVLLADDSEDDAFFFRWSLQKAGLPCELLHAADGVEARQLLDQAIGPDGRRTERCPDLVFLDLKMPGLTGFEVLEWIRTRPVSPPLDVAVLSGSEHASDLERAKALGATSYYVKPISAELLRARFESWQRRQAGLSSANVNSTATPADASAAPSA